MIIDFHTHAFPEKIAANTLELLSKKAQTYTFCQGTVEDLSQQMQKNGVHLSVVLPVVTTPQKTDKINDVAALINQTTAITGVFSFGGMHPDTEDYKAELNRIAALGLKGIKLHPAYQQVPLNDIRYKRIIDYADRLGLIVSVHGGLDIGIPGEWSTPKQAREIIDEIQPKKLVMAHMGAWQQWEESKEYLCGQDVYFDTAYCYCNIDYRADADENTKVRNLNQAEFIELVRLHGADKILFGSDSPWSKQQENLQLLQNMDLTEGEKAKILGENAKKLLGL